MTNKVTSQSDLNTIKNYIKNINIIKSEYIMTPCLPQSKSYLKIIGIPYIKEETNLFIISSDIKTTIQSMHIFNDTYLTLKLCVIKI